MRKLSKIQPYWERALCDRKQVVFWLKMIPFPLPFRGVSELGQVLCFSEAVSSFSNNIYLTRLLQRLKKIAQMNCRALSLAFVSNKY